MPASTTATTTAIETSARASRKRVACMSHGRGGPQGVTASPRRPLADPPNDLYCLARELRSHAVRSRVTDHLRPRPRNAVAVRARGAAERQAAPDDRPCRRDGVLRGRHARPLDGRGGVRARAVEVADRRAARVRGGERRHQRDPHAHGPRAGGHGDHPVRAPAALPAERRGGDLRPADRVVVLDAPVRGDRHRARRGLPRAQRAGRRSCSGCSRWASRSGRWRSWR